MNPANPPGGAISSNVAQDRPQPRHAWSLDCAWIALFLAAAATLRFLHLSAKSFWFDEGVSVAIARLDWYNFLRILSRHEANMALYYLLLRPWLLLGHGEAFVRALSVLFGLAAIPAIYVLGKQAYGRQAGLIAAALLTLNAFQIRYSQEARSYTLFMLLAILSSYFFLCSWRDPSRGNFRWHIATSVLAVYAHFFAALLIAVQWLWIRRQGSSSPMWRRDWRWIAILSAPLLIFVVTTGAGPLAWIPRPAWHELWSLAAGLAGNAGWPLVVLYVAAAAIAVVTNLLRDPQDPDRASTGFLLLWLVGPLVLVFLISQARSFFLARYFIFLLPALILLAARGIQALPANWMRVAALAVFLALSWRGTSAYYRQDFDIAREDWRQASNLVLTHAQPGDVLVFHVLMGRMPYEFYRWDRSGPNVIAPRHGDAITYQDFLGRPDRRLVESLASQHARVWLVLSHNQRGLGQGPDDTTGMIEDILGKAYARQQVSDFIGVEVRLYENPAGSAPQNEKAPAP